MWYWPECELTEYELEHVRLYKGVAYDHVGNPILDDKGKPKVFPGVLRRAYRGILNTEASDAPLLSVAHTSARIQISRRSRVFAITFAGDVANWRLSITTANGEQFTGKNPGAPQNPTAFTGADDSPFPIVASMAPGSFFSPVSSLGVPPGIFTAVDGDDNDVTLGIGNDFMLPLILEPNWQLVPNETLIFEGVPIGDDPLILEITVHAWEFPGMEGEEC